MCCVHSPAHGSQSKYLPLQDSELHSTWFVGKAIVALQELFQNLVPKLPDLLSFDAENPPNIRAMNMEYRFNMWLITLATADKLFQQSLFKLRIIVNLKVLEKLKTIFILRTPLDNQIEIVPHFYLSTLIQVWNQSEYMAN